jgi:hypothetical protein
MNKNFFIFPIVTGVVISLAGSDIVEQPIKTIFLIAVLCFTHEKTRNKQP